MPKFVAVAAGSLIARRRLVSLAILLTFLSGISPVRAQETGRKDGLFLTVANPITSDTTRALRDKVRDAVQRQKRDIKTIVFDFNRDDQPAATTSFGSCLELAELIRKLQLGEPSLTPPVDTIAYVHKPVTKHSVLPVIACRQLIMGPEGKVGDVPRDDLSKPTVRTAYNEHIKYHPTPDLMQRVVNPDLVLKRVKTPTGERIVSAATLDEWTRQGKDVSALRAELRGLEPGTTPIGAEAARDAGIATAIYETRGEVADALGLTRRSLSEDWIVDRTPVPWIVEVRGAIDAGKVQSLRRRIKHALSRNANLIVLQLESEAGDYRDVAGLAEELRTLKDNNLQPVRTIAWVPPGKSLGAATFLALGCSEVLMGENSSLGAFAYLRPEERGTVSEMLLPLARSQGYPVALFQATLDPKLTLVRVRPKTDANAPMLLVPLEEFQADQKNAAPRWNSFGVVAAAKNGLLRITPELAREFQLVGASDIDTRAGLETSLGLQADKVRVSRDDFLDQVAEFFREPLVNVALIMLGIAGLILEMKLPGTTVPGTIAAICFVLFFWAYSYVGEFTTLAVLLFVLGLIMIGVEIFVIPGFTFVGLTGILLVIGSLGLVTLDRWPATSHEWQSLGVTLGTFGLSMVAAVIGAIVATYYLPSIPYANRMILAPPSEESAFEKQKQPPARLLGAIGVSVTTLRPAGKGQFGDDFLDVIAEGDYVEPGKRLQIIEIEGNRIVVKEI